MAAPRSREPLEHAVQGEGRQEVLRPVADVDEVLRPDVLAAPEEVGGEGPAVLSVAGRYEPATRSDVTDEGDIGVLQARPERVQREVAGAHGLRRRGGLDEDPSAAELQGGVQLDHRPVDVGERDQGHR